MATMLRMAPPAMPPAPPYRTGVCSLTLLPGVGNELPRNFVKINAWDVSLSRRGDAESTRESTQGGGHWQLGLPVQRGGLRIARGRSRTSSRAIPRAFSRTKDGSRGCSLSRDSNIGTQENSKTPLLLRILGWWILWPHRRTGTMVRAPGSLRTGTKSDARPPTTRESGRTSRRRARGKKKTTVCVPG